MVQMAGHLEARLRTETTATDRHQELDQEDTHVVRTPTVTVMMGRRAGNIQEMRLIRHHMVVGEEAG